MIKLFGFATVALLLILPRGDDADAASLGGRITDEDQRPIEGAQVSASNVFSREIEMVQSDAAGYYKLVPLRQGRYSVFVKADGHGCTWVFNILLFRGQHTQLDIVLRRSQKKDQAGDCTKVWRSTR